MVSRYNKYYSVNINSVYSGKSYAESLQFVDENKKFIYAKNCKTNENYRIEKKTGKVFCNGKQIAETSKYEIY